MRLTLNTLGVVLGMFFTVVYGAVSLVTWRQGVDTYVSFLPWMKFGWETLVFLILIGAGLIMRKGPLSFKSALQYAFLAYLLYEVGYGFFNILIYNFLQKGFNHLVTVESLNRLITQSERIGAPVEQAKDSLAKELAHPSGPLTFLQLLLGFGQSLLFDFVKSMLIAVAIQKKVAPAADLRAAVADLGATAKPAKPATPQSPDAPAAEPEKQ